MQVAYKIIIWSLKVLWIGKWPSHGPFGENLYDSKADRCNSTPLYTESENNGGLCGLLLLDSFQKDDVNSARLIHNGFHVKGWHMVGKW